MTRTWISVVGMVAAVVTAVVAAVVFADRAGGEENARRPVAKPVYFRRVVVVSIGIEEFKSPKVPRVLYGEADARAVSQLMKEQFRFETIDLVGEKATKAAIFDQLGKLSTELSERDALIVFVATHGQTFQTADLRRHGFLLPYDATVAPPNAAAVARLLESPLDEAKRVLDEWRTKTIDMNELTAAIETIPVKHSLLLLDACHSGYCASSRSLTSGAIPQLLEAGSSRVVTATRVDQKAYPSREARHGFFTAALLKHLKLRDAACLTEVFFKVREEVARESGERMLPMMANLNDAQDGEFVFLPKHVAEADMKQVLKTVLANARGLVEEPTQLADVIRAFSALDYRYSEDPLAQEAFWKKEVELRRKWSALQDPLAMAVLHYCYSKGLGVEKDEAFAAAWAQQCFDTGEPVGKHVMGRVLLNGIGRTANEEYARRLIHEASELGFPISRATEALQLVGNRTISSLSLQEFQTLKTLLEPAVAANVPAAWTLLGKLTFNGAEEVAPDRVAGVEQFEKAAMLGDPLAELVLAEINSGAIAAELRDKEKAKSHLLRSVASGMPDALIMLANELVMGDEQSNLKLGFGKDERRARRLLEMASKQGNSRSKVMLAEMHESGAGGPPNVAEAQRLIEEAARSGDALAIAKQGMWYLNGQIYPQNNEQAFAKFGAAARANVPHACAMLGAMYEDGAGFSLNGSHPIAYKHEALYWYIKAHLAGNEFAKGKLKEFRGDLNVERVGIPSGELLEPSTILGRLRKEHPDEAAIFEKDFPGPATAAVAEPKILDCHSRLLGFGSAQDGDPATAEKNARAAALRSAAARLVAEDAAEATKERAARIAQELLLAEDERTATSSRDKQTFAACALSWNTELLRDAFKTSDIPLRETGGGLFQSELTDETKKAADLAAIALVIDEMRRSILEVDRGPRPKLSASAAKLAPTVRIVDERYRNWTALLKQLVVHAALRAAELEWSYRFNDLGEVSFDSNTGRPLDLSDRTLEVTDRLPTSLLKWPELRSSTLCFLIESPIPEKGRKEGKVNVLFALLPAAEPPAQEPFGLRLQILDAEGNDVKSETNSSRVDLAVGPLAISRTVGDPLATDDIGLVCFPLFGHDAFSLRREQKIDASLSLTKEQAIKAADWKVELTVGEE